LACASGEADAPESYVLAKEDWLSGVD